MANPEDDELRRIYRTARTIAVVGASADESKPAHTIPRYLQRQGYRVIPVNPRGGEILGERAYRSLREIDIPVDVVDIFRPSREADEIAREAIAVGAKVLWFQPGTDSYEAIERAQGAGLMVVARRCMGATHRLLRREFGPHRTSPRLARHDSGDA